jgi:type I restriction enzyme R subunit
LKQDIKICLVKNGYPPQYTPEVFREVMEQVENFKENEPFKPTLYVQDDENYEYNLMLASDDKE